MDYTELVKQIEILRSEVEKLKTRESPVVATGTWTPTVTQSGAVAATVTYATYKIRGNVCHVEVWLDVTGAGVAGNDIVIGGQPALIQPVNFGAVRVGIGVCTIVDVGTAFYWGMLTAVTATNWRVRDSNTRGIIGTNPNFALANTDVIIFNATYDLA